MIQTNNNANDYPQIRPYMERLHHMDEAGVVELLLQQSGRNPESQTRVFDKAHKLVETIRNSPAQKTGIDAFMNEYGLSNNEGVTLMCLAEALLRIPDVVTIDALIKDKITEADWAAHLGSSASKFVNASTWALMLTGKVLDMESGPRQDLQGFMKNLVAKSGEPVIRKAMLQAMRILGHQFVMGRTIDEALKRAKADRKNGYRHSFDMLGEGARTENDAKNYMASYLHAIEKLKQNQKGKNLSIFEAPGISVKLSAIHPRLEDAHIERLQSELYPRIKSLALAAKNANIGLCIDAEESWRQDVTLDVFEYLLTVPELSAWDGLGMAIQAYQKRAMAVIDRVVEQTAKYRRKVMIRLVKGAYWDSEIKRAQELGLKSYPVFTRKPSTDLSYLVCAEKLFAASTLIFPQFATHNAHTLASVLEMADNSERKNGHRPDFEFQRLHGMGDALYDQIVSSVPCRIYAPVGNHEDLLAYLVRRLLENGANSSFVNRLVDEKAPIENMITDPKDKVLSFDSIPHPEIPLPERMFKDRTNSNGLDLGNRTDLSCILDILNSCEKSDFSETAALTRTLNGKKHASFTPQNRAIQLAHITEASLEDTDKAVVRADQAFQNWNGENVENRAECLNRTATLLHENQDELIKLLVLEAGKTIPDAISEIREAEDFLRYYAVEAIKTMATPDTMPGPTGELNQLRLSGRGVFVCISPWNFPLAIFTGQIAAALVSGNTVIAKPAEQTPLMALFVTNLLHRSGIPENVLQCLPGNGVDIGQALVAHEKIAGVVFTGSTVTARLINQTLAAKPGPIIPLIAETGGINAMVACSSSVPEQLVDDVISSAFISAGQRCSALRVLFLHEDIADKVIEMIKGAMDQLSIGNPARIATDIGPVIDDTARQNLLRHCEKLEGKGCLLHRVGLKQETENGTFVAPHVFEIENISVLEKEVFGPVLHIIRYKADDLLPVAEQINSTGYGLTFGVHSRIEATHKFFTDHIKAGNVYINRNMIRAVVGVQPFGGQGLSGTGPKAGGPHYLTRFVTEQTITNNTAASGGNAELMTLIE